MRLLICSLSALLLISCNVNYPADSASAMPGRITKAQVLDYLPGVRLGRSQTVKTIVSNRESFRIKADFITHSRFLFLDFAENKRGQLQNYQNITREFDSTGITQTQFYDITHSSLELQYQHFLGRNVVVNTTDRTQVQYKISKLVLVDGTAYDQPNPYLAAVLEIPKNTVPDYAWATTNKRLNPYPFTPVEDGQLASLALTHFDSLTEYQNVKNMRPGYGNTSVRIFEFRKTEKYVVVQYYAFGPCNSLEADYMALYHVTPQHWVREAEGSVNFHFDDLIDLDGDLYPELLMRDRSRAAIYEINYRGFSEVKSIRWSVPEWPC